MNDRDIEYRHENVFKQFTDFILPTELVGIIGRKHGISILVRENWTTKHGSLIQFVTVWVVLVWHSIKNRAPLAVAKMKFSCHSCLTVLCSRIHKLTANRLRGKRKEDQMLTFYNEMLYIVLKRHWFNFITYLPAPFQGISHERSRHCSAWGEKWFANKFSFSALNKNCANRMQSTNLQRRYSSNEIIPGPGKRELIIYWSQSRKVQLEQQSNSCRAHLSFVPGSRSRSITKNSRPEQTSEHAKYAFCTHI